MYIGQPVLCPGHFRANTERGETGNEYALEQCDKCTRFDIETNNVLKCVSTRCNMTHKVDRRGGSVELQK